MKETVKLHMVCISSSNDRHPVLKYPRHYTYKHFTSSHLIFSALHYNSQTSHLV